MASKTPRHPRTESGTQAETSHQGPETSGGGKAPSGGPGRIDPDSPDALINRELSWLGFARRVLAIAEDPAVPLLERVKFAGIMGMLYDEFAMKRMGGLKRRIKKKKRFRGSWTPEEELKACRKELTAQTQLVSRLVRKTLRPALEAAGIPILDYEDLLSRERSQLRRYFRESIAPLLTPLAVDIAHPFPFISALGLNLAVTVKDGKKDGKKDGGFVRIKIPANRPRWVQVPKSTRYVPLEQVIAANLDLLFGKAVQLKSYCFRINRIAKDDPWEQSILDDPQAELAPGSLIAMVKNELTARKFSGVVRLQVSSEMPKKLQHWLVKQLKAEKEDLEVVKGLLGLSDLMRFQVDGFPELRDAPHEPVTHPRLRRLDTSDPSEIFSEIRRGDILLHHPYHSFDNSTLRFLQSAAVDPSVLAIKLTLYRTTNDSAVIQSLVEAARRGKQVAALMEITARFDEASNIRWGRQLEQAGVHVAYGVERLKTHVKMALVVREEAEGVRRYFHAGTGNYHPGTARIYEDLGILSCNPELGGDVTTLFNVLTGAVTSQRYSKLMVAPHNLLRRFVNLIRREARHARSGRPSGIRAKLNQLQDDRIIRELYKASQAGVPISLNVRGLCCLRAGVPGLSENIRVFSIVGRYLEHGRVYRFENGGNPEYFIGSADWMRRSFDRRMESIMPVTDPLVRIDLEQILSVFENDNCSAWDMQPDGGDVQRKPREGEECRAAQNVFAELALQHSGD